MTTSEPDAESTRPAVLDKLGEWTRRYLVIEVIGTAGELGCATVCYLVTGSLAAAAVAATIGANVGYYGPAWWRGYRSSILGPGTGGPMTRHARAGIRAVWFIVLEFGPGEAVDSLLVRPALFYAVPVLLAGAAEDPGTATLFSGWVIGKVLADIVFYACTVASYEINKSRLPVVGSASGVPGPAADGEGIDDGTDVSQSAR